MASQREVSGRNVGSAKMPESDLHCVRGRISTWQVDVIPSSNSLYNLSTSIFSFILIGQRLYLLTHSVLLNITPLVTLLCFS